MAKKNLQAEEEQRRLEEEALRQEAEKAKKLEELRAIARKQEETEFQIMDGLVENYAKSGSLEILASEGLHAEVWYLRFMMVERLGYQLLFGEEYTEEQLQSWLVPYALQDENSYVRRAAIRHLTNISAISEAALQDSESIVRKKAVEQLFRFLEYPEALEALGSVAKLDPVAELRHMAVLRLIDQEVLSLVARTDSEPEIRQSAAKKLTSQDELAWVAINDPSLPVRSAAAELITDASALVHAAAQVDSSLEQPQATEPQNILVSPEELNDPAPASL